MAVNLHVAYQNFNRESRITAVCAVAASILFAGSLITIICSLSCLQLPGVNARTLAPVLAPASIAFVGSIPMIALTVIKSRAKNAAYRPYVDGLKDQVDAYNLPAKPTGAEKKAAVKYFSKTLMNPQWSPDFRASLLSTLSKKYPKGSSTEKALKEAKDNAFA